jgi:hypothetical protein
MKYVWELTIYFTFYVFPFINQVFTDTAFVVPYLDLFARLGGLNHGIQSFINDYYHWKKAQPVQIATPNFFDFMFLEPLKKAEALFYETGLSGPQCMKVLKRAMHNVEQLGRFIIVYIYSSVLHDESLLFNKELAESIKIEGLKFDPAKMRSEVARLGSVKDVRLSKLAPDFLACFGKNNGHAAGESHAESDEEASVPIAAAKYAARR